MALELADVGENAPELPGPGRKVGLRDAQARERGDLADDLGGDGQRIRHPKNCKASPLIPKENRRRHRRAPGATRDGAGSPRPNVPALSSLLRRPELAALARTLRDRGERGWIVGGAARDLLLRRPHPDVDLAVSGDPFAIARALEEAGLGTAVPLSESAPRVARVAGRREIDLAEVEGGSILADLGRRDFTVNALAVDLVDRSWIDPFGGRDDLSRKRLKMISEANLRDDPLRVLRAARFVATHGLVPDPATTAACARAARRLASAAPERIRAELEKLLAAPRAVPALAWAARAGMLRAAFGLPLSRARAAALIRRTPLDSPSIRRRAPDERLRLRLVLLAARLGFTPPAAAAWLVDRRFSRSTAREIAAIAGLASEAALPADDSVRWGWVGAAGARAENALLAARLLHGSARRTIARYASAVRRQATPPRVRGEDVLAWLGIAPGPAVGKWLGRLEIEGLRGAVRTRAEARRWLLAQASPLG